MSKIIKAHDPSEICRFDFKVIDTGEPGCDPAAASAAQEPAEPQAPLPDPLEELEALIQNRLLEAERKAQELEKEAYAKGYAQGERDGLEYGTKSTQIIHEHLERVLTGLQALPRRVLEDYRQWLISTALAMARHIVARELALDPGLLAQTITTLLDEAEAAQNLTLHLHPKDMELLQKNPKLRAIVTRTEGTLAFQADSTMKRGGCRLESDIQILDASLDARFALIEQALAEADSDAP